jgi:hypothetical protein
MNRKIWTDEKLFFRLLNNKSDKTYWENIRELRSRDNVNVFDTCAKLIKSSKPNERIIGIDILAQLGLTPRPFYRESKKIFFEVLRKEKNPKALLSVLYAIGHNNEKLKSDEITLLASFKGNTDEGVRQGLVSALLAVDNKLAIDTLIHLTSDKISHIRDWATFGIGTQIRKDNKDIRKALWARINDKDNDTRYEAIVGLANRKDKNIFDVIKTEFEKPNFGAALFEAISAIKAKEYLPKLKTLLKESKNDKTINESWKIKLKYCITELNESE